MNRRVFLKTSTLGVGVGAGATVVSTQSLPVRANVAERAIGLPERTAIEFLDPRTVEHTYFLDRKVTPVRKSEKNPILADCHSAQSVVKTSDGRLRMWYLTRRKIPGYKGSAREYVVRYAESADGLTWELPELGLKEFDGSRKNNVLFTANDHDAAGRSVCGRQGIDCFCVIDGEQRPTPHARGRFTALFHPYKGICAAYSDDGLRWTAYPENPAYRPDGSDTYNNFLFDTRIGRYVLYHRPHPHMHAGASRANRLVARVESDDLLRWDNARCVLDTDASDAPAFSEVDKARGRDLQFYAMAVTQYQDFYLGMANLLNELTGEMDVRLVYSFDGIDWRREPVEEAFIAPTPDAWDSGMISFVSASCPLRMGDDLYFYYGASNMTHNYKIMNEEKGLRMRLGLGIVKKGRLVGYHAGSAEGELLTRPFVLDHSLLTLNADAASGEIKSALVAEDGTPIPGYSMNEADPIRKDGFELPLRWNDKADLRNLAGKKIRLRITARNAALFGLSAVDDRG